MSDTGSARGRARSGAPPDRFVGLTEAVELSGLSRGTLYRWIASGSGDYGCEHPGRMVGPVRVPRIEHITTEGAGRDVAGGADVAVRIDPTGPATMHVPPLKTHVLPSMATGRAHPI